MIDTAIKASEEAARILKTGFGKEIDRVYKEDFSPVTQFDSQAEEAIIKIIKEKYPDHNILAEESGTEAQGHNFTWIIDPLDGTSNFSKGIPFFGVGIAVVKDNEIIISVVNDPFSGRIITAEIGKGTKVNGEKVQVSETNVVEKSLVSFARGRSPEVKEKFKTLFNSLSSQVRTPRILGSTVLEFASVATGAFDGMVIYGSKPWDAYSGVLLVREAGGRVTNFSGQEWKIGEDEYLATNGKIHEEILSILKNS